MFIFGDMTSDEMGLKVTQYSLRQKARQVGEFVNLPGRAEPIWEDAEYFDPVTITVTCDVLDQSKIDDIFGWLHGRGILIDERHPDKYRIARAYGEITTEAVNDEILTLSIPFECDPFLYSVDNTPIEIATASDIIITGTYYCEPIIDLYFKSGSTAQDLTVYINGQGITLSLTADHLQHAITLNSQSQKVYYKDTNFLILPDTTGAVPFMNTGVNSISWDVDILEKLVITKNERWL